LVWSPDLAGVLEGNTNIERRITMINRFKTPSRVGTLLAMIAMALLGAAVLTDAKEESGSPSEPSTYFLVSPESGAQPVAVPITEQQAPPEENAAAVSEKAPPDAVGRMGVYDKGLILKSWKKVKESYAKLQAEVNEKQKGIDKLSLRMEKEKTDYDKAKPGLSSAERDAREAKIASMYQDYKATLAKEQADIDTKEQVLIKDRLAELEKVAAGVGAQLGCVAVQPTDDNHRKDRPALTATRKPSTRETVDITSRVLQVLNKE
jgi:Skp family chaperone for outer membrane proteins